MQIWKKWLIQSRAVLWFLLALLWGGLFLILTVIYVTGGMAIVTLRVEQWLLLRPVTRLDCMFFEWRNLGEVSASVLFIFVLSGICLYLGYRRRVLFYLLLLLLLGIGVELVGKQLFALTYPAVLSSGMTALACPQLYGQRWLVHLASATGVWWLIPSPSASTVEWARNVSVAPLTFNQLTQESSYPGGHAIRGCYLGLLAFWLARKHIKRRIVRMPAMICLLMFACGPGFMQFYIGSHFIADTISGYLLGASLACCAIGLLILNDACSAHKTSSRFLRFWASK